MQVRGVALGHRVERLGEGLRRHYGRARAEHEKEPPQKEEVLPLELRQRLARFRLQHVRHARAAQAEARTRGDEDVAGMEHDAAGGPGGVHGADGRHQLHGEGPDELLRQPLRRSALPVGRDVAVP